jgi:hypothetical protein
VDADGFEIFSGIILIFKDEILMYMAQNASKFADYSLKLLVHHKRLLLRIFFSRWGITNGFPLAALVVFMRPLIIANYLLVHLKLLKRARLSARGNRRSLLQAALVNILQIMECLVGCTLKFYLQILK